MCLHGDATVTLAQNGEASSFLLLLWEMETKIKLFPLLNYIGPLNDNHYFLLRINPLKSSRVLSV